MVKIIDGKFEANEILEYTRKKIEYIIENFGKRPKLVTVLVGNNHASQIYINAKIKKSKEVGINADLIGLESATDKFQLIKLINSLNNDDDINAILVQLPLPKPLDDAIVYKHINHEKDVDAFGFLNTGLLIHKKSFVLPCTPSGILYILKKYMKNLSGKKAVVIGRSIIVGKPIASILLNENCTVVCTHSKTEDLKKECQSAD
ncbi:MAG: methylenetetrahydrofolate dehydrogenase (NADP+)/methenyltetrahydrofolate cyclohydrolase, partial [Candidatus Midichloriaceae bacterium]